MYIIFSSKSVFNRSTGRTHVFPCTRLDIRYQGDLSRRQSLRWKGNTAVSLYRAARAEGNHW